MTEHKQVPLFGDDDPLLQLRSEVGAVEHHTRRALAAAALDDDQAGAAAALCALAWAIDAARAAGKFYGVAQAAPPYTDLARALGLTADASKGGDPSGIDPDGWLRQLTDPALGDTPQP